MTAVRANGMPELTITRCAVCHRNATPAQASASAGTASVGRGELIPAPMRLFRPDLSEGDAATDDRLREASDELMTRLQQLRRLHPAELLLVREMIVQLNVGIAAAAALVQPGASLAQISRCTSAWVVDEREQSGSTPCTICLDEFSCGERVRTLPCFHSFHCVCVDAWFGKSRLCPLCQYDITSAPPTSDDAADADAADLEPAAAAGAHAPSSAADIPTGVNLFSV
jgi:hypothetical protein